MPGPQNFTSADIALNYENIHLQNAISAFAKEAYTNAKKLTGTGLVSSGNGTINTDTETFIGQFRWKKPLNPKINIASLTDATPGDVTNTSSDYAQYVKSARTHGAREVNLAQLVTKENGLAQVGQDFSETRAQDEHDAILAVLKGVAISEMLNGAASGSGAAGNGGQTFENDPTDKSYGFYVDLGNTSLIADASAAVQGAARAEGFLEALGKAWKDYEPEYAYLVVSPQVLASLRSANLIDSDKVSEAGINFESIFGGKFRLIKTRANQSLSTAQLTKINTGAGVADITGPKTSFIVLPGSLAFEQLSVPMPTEIWRDAKAFKGGGTTEIWYRWGYIFHPAGYTWAGNEDEFVSNDGYMSVSETIASVPTQVKLTDVTTIGNTKGVWQRKTSSALSLGILPVFHG